jgi:hypothetical protein
MSQRVNASPDQPAKGLTPSSDELNARADNAADLGIRGISVLG